ncbi:hypothetical protein C2G38_2246305 [Gigaspora rosea]|uniref:Ser-Thr-rich glycosyl-phosphatidyl-inositol-anchored membrane family-domain-containing protein n=1 Tax=Gigaspora rosea TaxID=44941 RepID=A0A397VE55_9GLOM|nr:hypothetical protein C2G38_2246305 [Gigaspora rosea]
MNRFIAWLTFFIVYIILSSAQIVDELNTPIGPISQNTKVTVTWTLLPDKDANNKYGQLSATNLYKTDVTIIDSKVPLAPKSYTWEVSLQAGEYILGLDDGTELKQSGEVEVRAP